MGFRESGVAIESLVDRAIEAGVLAVDGPVAWRQGEGHLKARLPVQHSEEEDFRLELIWLPIHRRFSITLLYQRYRVRCLCSNTPHVVPRDCPDHPGERLFGLHKHRWSDITGDECIYIPDDISTASPEQAFYDFCAESGVAFTGVWNDPPPWQPPLALGG